MSKKNNLKDYLTDLYQGISSKKPGASRNPQDFRSEIESIQGGGVSLEEFDGVCKVTGTPTEEEHAETLYEYDGACRISGEVSNELPSGYVNPDGELKITENGIYPVTDKESVWVDIPTPDGYVKPSGSVTLTSNGTHDVSGKATVIVAVPETPEWDGSFTKSVNNLTGTTWEIASGWEAEAGLGQFEVNCTYEGNTYNRLGIGYGWEASLQAPFPFNNFALLYNEGTTEYAKMSSSNAYILSITGGKDVGSATLQDWLLRYGKLQ